MSMHAEDMTKPIIAGWYEEGKWVGDRRDDKDYKNFEIDHVFTVVDPVEERFVKRIE